MFARCVTKTSSAEKSVSHGEERAAEEPEIKRRKRRRCERRERRETQDARDKEPRRASKRARAPVEGQHDAEKCRDTLAALEAQPDGKEMPKKSGKARHQGHAVARKRARQHDGERALAAVAQERGERGDFASGPEHIGGADIARALLAQIAEAPSPSRDHTERYGAEQIAAKNHDGQGRPEFARGQRGCHVKKQHELPPRDRRRCARRPP